MTPEKGAKNTWFSQRSNERVRETMIVACPKCGGKVLVNGLGRKRLNIPLKNVYDAVQAQGSVAGAARKLGCSPAYIFKVLKDNGVSLKEVLGGAVKNGG